MTSAAIAALAFAIGGGCVDATNAGEDPLSSGFLRAEGRRLVDDEGREVVLRGINARIEGLFDVTFDDGRVSLQPIPAFTRDDLVRIRETLGMNALRIPINWSGLQPDGPGALSSDYLARLDAVLTDCAETETWCLVDLHQDAYSKEIGEDGAPLWAIVPAPTALLEGPLTDLAARRGSPQVLAAFDTFFSGREGVQDAFLDMLGLVTEHLRGRPFVAGIEVFNEPVGDTLDVLQFSARAVDVVQAKDPDRLVVFEPPATRNLLDTTDPMGGLGRENVAYAPHLYPEVFSGSGDSWGNGDVRRLVESTAAAADEAAVHDAPLVVTEYGIDPESENGLAWIARMEDEMDIASASRFFWLYEEVSQDRWGLFDEERQLRDALVDVLARPFPAAIEGELVSWVWANGALEMVIRGAGRHEVALPAGHIARAAATCDGASVAVERVAHGVRAYCGDGGTHTLVVSFDAE